MKKNIWTSRVKGSHVLEKMCFSSDEWCPAVGLFISTGAVAHSWDCAVSTWVAGALLSSQALPICPVCQGRELGCCEHSPSAQGQIMVQMIPVHYVNQGASTLLLLSLDSLLQASTKEIVN